MARYRIEKEIETKKIGRKKIIIDGYAMKPKLRKREDFIEVKEIIIVLPTFKENFLKSQFQIVFKRLLKIIMSLNEATSTDGDFQIILNEIEKARRILKDKYRQNISNSEYRTMLKKMTFLEQEVKNKMILHEMLLQNVYEQQLEEERGRGR